MIRPDPLAMNDFNVLTFNGKAFPGTEPIVAEVGDLVRIRLANLGPMDHHPIHLHGHTFEVVATDGGPIPASARHPDTTVLVPVGSTRTIEFVASAPGDWAFHCHMGPHGMIDMGGMFTILKVRENLAGNADPGWYVAPKGTTAAEATAAELERDGVEL